MFISPFVASPESVVKRLLTLADLRPNELLYDLGAGDGRAIIMAAREFGARAIGVELRDDLAKQTSKKISDLDLNGRVKLIHEDLFKIDLRQADVIYLYLTTSANDKIRPKLENELKKGARVVSHDYEILGWKALKVERFCENPKLEFPTHTLYLYKK